MAIKLGIIGLGQRMSDMLNSLRQVDPDLEVTAILDRDKDLALAALNESEKTSVRFFESVDDLVRRGKVDALAIGTRCDTHTPFAVQAAAYDLPLFLEKPVSNSMAQAHRLDRAFRRSRCRVLVSFPLRASRLCERVKWHLNSGAVGRVEHILATNYVHYGSIYFFAAYRNYAVTQGLFLQKATHDFDYLAWLTGSPITRVAAMISQGRVFRDTSSRKRKADPFAIYADGIGTPETGMNEDSSSALLEFENGAKAVYTQVFFSKRDAARRGAIISGFAGTLSFDWYQNQLTCVRHYEPFTETTTVDNAEAHFGGDAILAENFVAMIKDNAPSIAPIGAGLASVYACLAAKQSAMSGKFVKVRPVTLRT